VTFPLAILCNVQLGTVETLSHLTATKLLKLSALLFPRRHVSSIAVAAFPDLGHLLSRVQGGTALYPQELPVLEDLYR
jgi:hypothetical protein